MPRVSFSTRYFLTAVSRFFSAPAERAVEIRFDENGPGTDRRCFMQILIVDRPAQRSLAKAFFRQEATSLFKLTRENSLSQNPQFTFSFPVCTISRHSPQIPASQYGQLTVSEEGQYGCQHSTHLFLSIIICLHSNWDVRLPIGTCSFNGCSS